MSIWQAILLGLIQGLTEFLPVSSSGHIELGKHILGISMEDDLAFTVALHGATVLSTIVALWPEMRQLLFGVCRWKWNAEMQYAAKIAISMIPVALVGLLTHDKVESLFDGNVLFVGLMLLLTALLLAASTFAHRTTTTLREQPSGPTYWSALLMGIGQAIAVLPGLSRSGTTIAIGLLSGTKRQVAAQFSFLMVIPPILGMNLLEVLEGEMAIANIGLGPLAAGVISAFVSGYIACRWMVSLVRRGKMIWFAIYCAAIGILAIAMSI